MQNKNTYTSRDFYPTCDPTATFGLQGHQYRGAGPAKKLRDIESPAGARQLGVKG